jgi:hypothetical protein
MGIVMLPKLDVPLSPVTVKDNVVVLADWLVAIVTFDICELVTFPLIAMSTVVPLSVVASTVVADGVGVSDDAVVGIGVSVGIWLGLVDGVELGVADKFFNAQLSHDEKLVLLISSYDQIENPTSLAVEFSLMKFEIVDNCCEVDG